MSERLVSRIDRLHSTPQRLLQQQARRQVRLDRDGLALEVAHRLDGAIRRPTVAAGGYVDRADDDALRVLAPAEALVLADGAQVAVDVAALHGRDRVRHVVVQDLDDRDPLVREIAELVGQMHRSEADPHRVGAGHGVRLAHGGMGVRRPDAGADQGRYEPKCERQLLARARHGDSSSCQTFRVRTSHDAPLLSRLPARRARVLLVSRKMRLSEFSRAARTAAKPARRSERPSRVVGHDRWTGRERCARRAGRYPRVPRAS